MYAIVKTGGKQYRVEEGQTLLVERLPGDAGAKLDLEPLLLRGGRRPVRRQARARSRWPPRSSSTCAAPSCGSTSSSPSAATGAGGPPPGAHADPRDEDLEGELSDSMAHKKGLGSSKNGRDSNAQFLGRQDLRRRGRHRRRDHRPSARLALQGRRGRRHGQGRHALRQGAGHPWTSRPAAAAASCRCCRTRMPQPRAAASFKTVG